MKLAKKIGIGVALGIVVIIAVVFWAQNRVQSMQTFFYPLAPPMPAIVDEPMPEVLAHLESVLRTNAPQILTGLKPGISAEEIGGLEKQYNVHLPDDIKAIYEWHDGAKSSTNYFANFIPIHRFMPLEEMLGEKCVETASPATPVQHAAYGIFAGYRDTWYYLLDDGSGNGYFFDPTRKPAQGAVFCAFVEDNDFTFFPSPKNLMAGIARCYEQGAYCIKPGSSPLELDEDFDQSTKIWSEFGASNHQ